MFFMKKPAVSWIIVFLGNPGAKYTNTRHNAGFLAADALAKSEGLSITRLRYHALTARWELPGAAVIR